MFNSLSIIGRLTKDPEQFVSQSGIAFTRFSIAHDKEFTKHGETYFFDVVAWRSTAVFITKHFKKGQLILIAGKLAVNTWTDKNGLKHNDVQIEADTAHFYGGKSEEANASSEHPIPDSISNETTEKQDLPPEQSELSKLQNSEKETSRFNRMALENHYKHESEDD